MDHVESLDACDRVCALLPRMHIVIFRVVDYNFDWRFIN